MSVAAAQRCTLVCFFQVFCLLVLMWLGTAVSAECSHETDFIAGFSRDKALQLGEDMYRKGVLPSGAPMRAIVQGDIPVQGTMFTCISCHLRSGVGSIEGTVITLPTNGPKLYNPLTAADVNADLLRAVFRDRTELAVRRPAYTDETLARVLRSGENPAGRQLDLTMPRYLLDARDMEILVFYLKNLSAAWSPGVTDSTLRFATVVTGEVSPRDKNSMLKPLEWFVKAKNSRARYQQRKTSGRQFVEDMDRAYRKFSLEVWELRGDPETWPGQLESHYQNSPVFALLGGISYRDWSPIHNFCEQKKLPCILPVTQLPVISDSDWYTLYFSKGLYQEGEAAARYLGSLPGIDLKKSVIQIYRDEQYGRAMAKAFSASWKGLGGTAPVDVAIPQGALIEEELNTLINIKGGSKDTTVMLWIGDKDLSGLQLIGMKLLEASMFFVSSTLLGDSLFSLPEGLRQKTYITWPHQLPGDLKKEQFSFVSQLLNPDERASSALFIAAKTNFLGNILVEILMHMKNNFYRDYFLDIIGMLPDHKHKIPVYPRLSFGPGQRYASKGCYIVQLSKGDSPELIKKSDWVMH